MTRQNDGDTIWSNGRCIRVERRPIKRPEADPGAEDPAGIDVRASLVAIADRIRRLFPLSGNPEAFHVDKDSICNDLMMLSRALPRRLAHVKQAANPR